MSGSADVQARIRCAVVGAGVVGLSVSHQLLEQLHAAGAAVELTVIADSFYEQTTSYGCGGFWEPYQVGGTSQDLIVRWGSFTYRYIE